jgi:pseudouridine kinase
MNHELSSMNHEPSIMNAKVICIGAALVDELFYCIEPVVPGSSNPATMRRTAGGVVRNIAHHLVLLDIPTSFITVVGNDPDGEWLVAECKRSGMEMHIMKADAPTGKYAAIINPDGSLYTAAAINPCETYLTIELLQQQSEVLLCAAIVLADTNLKGNVLGWLIQFCKDNNIPIFIEPVSASKAKRLQLIDLHGVWMTTPNEDEICPMTAADDMPNAVQELLQRGVKNVWLTKGAQGSSMYRHDNVIHLPAAPVSVTDMTGAGDAALAAYIAAWYRDMDQINCMKAGHSLAALVLQQPGAVCYCNYHGKN